MDMMIDYITHSRQGWKAQGRLLSRLGQAQTHFGWFRSPVPFPYDGAALPLDRGQEFGRLYPAIFLVDIGLDGVIIIWKRS